MSTRRRAREKVLDSVAQRELEGDREAQSWLQGARKEIYRAIY